MTRCYVVVWVANLFAQGQFGWAEFSWGHNLTLCTRNKVTFFVFFSNCHMSLTCCCFCRCLCSRCVAFKATASICVKLSQKRSSNIIRIMTRWINSAKFVMWLFKNRGSGFEISWFWFVRDTQLRWNYDSFLVLQPQQVLLNQLQDRQMSSDPISSLLCASCWVIHSIRKQDVTIYISWSFGNHLLVKN